MSGRVIAQLIMMGAGIITKAFMQAYAQAKQGGGAAARAAAQAGRMPSDQAREVLQVAKGAINKEEVMAQFAKYYESNDPDKCVQVVQRAVCGKEGCVKCAEGCVWCAESRVWCVRPCDAVSR